MTTPKQSEALDRFRKLIPFDDIPLIILKGHLLIEEQLNTLVENLARDPKSIRKARLRFGQLARVAQGLTYEKNTTWLWSAIDELNTLRNRLAHRTEPGDIKDLATKLIATVTPLRTLKRSLLPRSLSGRLRVALTFLHAVVVGLDESRGPNAAA
jgi:hypothetical protein